MKAHPIAVFCCSTLLIPTAALSQVQTDPVPVASTDYAIAARDGNQKIWSKVTWESNSLTGELTATTNSFIELATASAHLVNGVWVDSSDQIEITETGAQATNSQHKVAFLGNINALGAGTVKEIRVGPGDTVGPGDVLVVIG